MSRQRRRDFLRATFLQLGLVAVGATLMRCHGDEAEAPAKTHEFPGYNPPAINPPATSNIANIGALGMPDENGLRLPDGFTARVVARSGQPVAGSGHIWHAAPDGGATFLAEDGGYVYVSNSETLFDGGVSALRFDANGQLLDAYPILSGTQINCAGGPTPWGTWLSCEEKLTGQVWECDPFGRTQAVARPALGVFKHEAVTVDPTSLQLYLTEDVEDGRLYRYTPAGTVKSADGGDDRPDLTEGTLEVLQIVAGNEGAVSWLVVPDPSAVEFPTRIQVPESTAFDGGEGIWYHKGIVYFTTKGDNRVWALDTVEQDITIIYDDDTAADPILSGVDNVVVSAGGDILVAEDGGDMQIVAISGDKLTPLVQVMGQDKSEITGPALDPYRKRLYFSSQRGVVGGIGGEDGVTYEITGPFFI